MMRRPLWYLLVCACIALLVAGMAVFAACAGDPSDGPSGGDQTGGDETGGDETGGDETGDELQSATITLSDLTFVYDGTSKTATATVTPQDAGTVSVEYYIGETKVTECVNAGEYTVRATLVSETHEAESVEETLTVSPKELTVGGIVATDKYADGNAAVQYTGTASLVGVVGEDEVTVSALALTADSAAYGIGKAVTAAGTLDGADAANYRLAADTSLTVNIYPVQNGFCLLPAVEQGEATAYTVTSYGGDAAAAIVPASLDGVPVTQIADGAFKDNAALTKVTVPADVDFGVAAFEGCTSLTSVILEAYGFEFRPNFAEGEIVSAAAVGYGGVGGDGGEVSVPASFGGAPVTELGAHLFAGNATVTDLTIPASVTTIGLALAQNATALETVTFEDRTQDIVWGMDTFGAWTFAGSSVQSIDLGDGLVTVPKIFATGAASLQAVTFGNAVASIGAEAFKNCTSLGNVDLPASLQTIEADAFRDCTALSSVVIPASVTKMGTAVFQGDTSLTSVTFADRAQTVEFALGDLSGSWMFFGCTALDTVVIGDGITALPAIFAPTAAAKVTLGKDVASLGSESFPRAGTVTELTLDSAAIAQGLTAADVYDNAFAGVTTLRLADGVEASVYITTNFTEQSQADGYTVYSKNA